MESHQKDRREKHLGLAMSVMTVSRQWPIKCTDQPTTLKHLTGFEIVCLVLQKGLIRVSKLLAKLKGECGIDSPIPRCQVESVRLLFTLLLSLQLIELLVLAYGLMGSE